MLARGAKKIIAKNSMLPHKPWTGFPCGDARGTFYIGSHRRAAHQRPGHTLVLSQARGQDFQWCRLFW